MQNKLLNSVLLGCALLYTGAALAADAPVEKSGTQEPFAEPFSRKLKIISQVEMDGLSRFGQSGLTEYVVKAVPDMHPGKYKIFDESIVMAVNAGEVAPEMIDYMRGLVRAQVTGSKFTIAEPDKSQAGIASIFSTFRTLTGAVTTELLVVVFDRDKMRSMLKAQPELRVIDAVFGSAIRAMVSHLYPATVLDYKNGMHDAVTQDSVKILYQKIFSHFMEPTVAERGAPT